MIPSLAGGPLETVEPLWTFEIDDTNGVSFGRIVSSPTVTDIDDTRVVLFAGGATVYALDAATGAPLTTLCLDPRTDALARPRRSLRRLRRDRWRWSLLPSSSPTPMGPCAS